MADRVGAALVACGVVGALALGARGGSAALLAQGAAWLIAGASVVVGRRLAPGGELGLRLRTALAIPWAALQAQVVVGATMVVASRPGPAHEQLGDWLVLPGLLALVVALPAPFVSLERWMRVAFALEGASEHHAPDALRRACVAWALAALAGVLQLTLFALFLGGAFRS